MTPVSQPRRRSAAGAALSVALVLLMAPFARADVRTEARRHFRRGMQLILLDPNNVSYIQVKQSLQQQASEKDRAA